MRKLNLLFTVFVSIFLLSSCSSDDSPAPIISTNKGKLIINGVERPLTKAFVIPNYTGTNINYSKRRFYIVLTNGDVTLEDNDYVYSDNITQLIDFNMYCSIGHEGSIQNTTYDVYNTHPNVNSENAFIDHSGINTNVVVRNGAFVSANSLSSDDMENGIASISVDNGIYTINFSFSNGQNTITGNYIGTMTDLHYQYQ